MKLPLVCMVFSLCLLLTSCSENKTPGGVKYTVIKSGDGNAPAVGQFLVLNMEVKDAKDSVWFSSKSTGYPVVMPVPDETMLKDEGENGVFKQLTKGDSVYFELQARIVFLKTRKTVVPPMVDPSSIFKYSIGLQDVLSYEQAGEFQQRVLNENEAKRAKNDSLAIATYLNEKGISAQSTSSGLRYVVKKTGTGELAVTGKTAMVKYAGYLLDGSLFDTNIESIAKENNFNTGGRYDAYPVVVNTEEVISGWDEMLLLMNKGMKVTVFVPSALAYGSRSPGPEIPPNSILAFDLEVVDIK